MTAQMSKQAEQQRANEASLMAERLREILIYSPSTGEFRWRIGRQGVAAGSMAGCNNRGYRRIGIDGHLRIASRLAFLWMTGEWPRQDMDHINRNRSDDRWANLREASRTQNNANRGMRNNTGGMRGAIRDKKRRKWLAQVKISGKTRNLGRFATIWAAARAYDRAAIEAHGEFAVLNNLPHPQFGFDELMGSVEFLSARKCLR
jgi:HNH endonuclease/AP2 domain